MIVRTELDFPALRQRVRQWLGIVVEFSLAQGLAQAAGMLSGLIYVRMMPVDQYALYALCLTSLAVVSVGSDLGLTSSLSYFWRRGLQERQSIGSKIAAVRRLRAILFGASMMFGAALLFTSARAQSVPIASVAGCFALVVLTAWLQMRSTIDIHLLRLENQLRLSYYCKSAGGIVRLIAAAVMILTGISAAWFGLAGGLLGAIAVLIVLQAMPSSEEYRPAVAIDRKTWHELQRYLLPMLPGVAVYLLREPLTLWFAAKYAGASGVSEVFALGRVGMVLALLGNFVVVVVAPRLASIADEHRFTRMAVYALAILTLGCLALFTIAWLAPSVPLLLIGPRYAHLGHDVPIAVATSSIGILSSFLVMTNRMRGWVRFEPHIALCSIPFILTLAGVWNWTSTVSVLCFLLSVAAIDFLLVVMNSFVGHYRPHAATPSKT